MPGLESASDSALDERAHYDRRVRLIVAAYTLALLVGTHLPLSSAAAAELLSHDKVLHLMAYGVLGCLLAVAVTPRGGRLEFARGAAILAAVATLGAFDELTQPIFGRSCDLADWIADALGAALTISAYALWTRFRRG